jgi:hypothetical protein
MVPPPLGEWLFVCIGYKDTHAEIYVSWDGAPAKKHEQEFNKLEKIAAIEAYVGCEVGRKTVTNNLLCDLAYLRIWKTFMNGEKLVTNYADVDAPHPMLVAGEYGAHGLSITVCGCLHEDKGYILDLIPRERIVTGKISGRNFSMFPAVRGRFNMLTEYNGSSLCAINCTPTFVSPLAVAKGFVPQNGDVPDKFASTQIIMKTPVQFASPEQAVREGVPSGSGVWPCTRFCYDKRGNY